MEKTKFGYKKKEELIARCTVSIQGTLIGIAQSYYSHIDDNEQEQYNYNPIVRYEFGEKTYEIRKQRLF